MLGGGERQASQPGDGESRRLEIAHPKILLSVEQPQGRATTLKSMVSDWLGILSEQLPVSMPMSATHESPTSTRSQSRLPHQNGRALFFLMKALLHSAAQPPKRNFPNAPQAAGRSWGRKCLCFVACCDHSNQHNNIGERQRRGVAAGVPHTEQTAAQPPLITSPTSVVDMNMHGTPAVLCWVPCTYSRSRQQRLATNSTQQQQNGFCCSTASCTQYTADSRTGLFFSSFSQLPHRACYTW